MTEEKDHSLTRRNFALGAAGAAAMIGLGGFRYVPQTTICRPPGGQDENLLYSACLHCEKCREVCPKGCISPAHIEDGILAMRTPKTNFRGGRGGWCDFCENEPGGPKCIAACPTGALSASLPSPNPAYPFVIGIAEVNYDWCLANRGTGCHDCIDACPYDALTVQANHTPLVDAEKCNGCGKCQYVCPSMTNASLGTDATDVAIVVKPLER